MSLPSLSAPGIVLRPLTVADAPALFLAHGDPEVQKYRRNAEHKTIAETERYIEDTLTRAKGRAWAITESGGEALGRISLRNPHGGVGEIGILLRREAQRRGLASKALHLVEDYAFRDLSLHRLMADIDPENSASISLFLRAGFEREGVLRKHWMTQLGLRDALIMAKFRD